MKAIIVDDELIAVNAVKRRVDWNKYSIDKVFTAGSMNKAIEILKVEEIDLMLCDIEMPAGSGLELFEWVRTYSPHTECIFITCHAEYDYMRKAMKLGSMDYLLKPLDYEELDKILTKAVLRINEKNEVTEEEKKIVKKIVDSKNKKLVENPIDNAKRFIRENISENISIKDISEHVFLNPQYFMRMFKKETGMSILEYITKERIDLAKKLLATTDFPINNVAICVGYDNFSYFSKIFKRNTKMTPAEYRKSLL